MPTRSDRRGRRTPAPGDGSRSVVVVPAGAVRRRAESPAAVCTPWPPLPVALLPAYATGDGTVRVERHLLGDQSPPPDVRCRGVSRFARYKSGPSSPYNYYGRVRPPSSAAVERRNQVMTEGDVDPRFSLANERTFLAWIRTSLGLLAS